MNKYELNINIKIGVESLDPLDHQRFFLSVFRAVLRFWSVWKVEHCTCSYRWYRK